MSESPAAPGASALPSAEELAALPAGLLLAYASRAVLRVLPVFGQYGAFSEVWPVDAEASVEALLRAVQLGLVATATEGELALPFGAIERAAQEAGVNSALRWADSAALAAASLVHAAQVKTQGDQREVSAAVALAALHAVALAQSEEEWTPLLDAMQDDLAALRDIREVEQGSTPMQWFFRRPLWLAGRISGRWREWRDGWESALSAPEFAALQRLARRMETGNFDYREEAADLAAWAHEAIAPGEAESPAAPRVPPRSRFPGATPPAEEEGAAAEPAPADAAQSPSQSPSAPTPATPPRPRRVEERFGNDSATTVDTLNRAGLARLLASFLRDSRTKLPLTLSIEGRWGSGKSTLMRLLDEELKTPADAKTPRLHTVWFNPWRYQSHEELWAEFALVVFEALRTTVPRGRRWWADLRLTALCLDWPVFLRSALGLLGKLALGVGAVVVGYAFFEAGFTGQSLGAAVQTKEFWQDALGVPAGLAAGGVLLWQAITWVRGGLGGLLRHKLDVRLDRPDYEGRASFLTRFHRDLARVVRAYCERGREAQQRVVVLIDDLDRCEVPRAAELMQGINLMLGDEAPIVYVLGLDRAKVAAGIAQKHRDLLPFLYAGELAHVPREQQDATLRQLGLRYGYEFIEKFIQVPFRLPPTNEACVRGFIRSRLTLPAAKPSAQGTAPVRAATPATNRVGRVAPSTASSAPGDGGNASGPSANAEPAITNAAPPTANTAGASPSERATTKSEPAPEADETHLEEPLFRAAQVLENNPRRLAQLVNLVRLQRRLAHELGLRQVREGQLAKWTAVALRWPMFLVDLEDDHAILGQLVAEGRPEAASARYLRWEASDELVRFLRDQTPGPGDEADASYDLTAPGVVEALLQLSVTVPVARVTAAAASKEVATKEAAEAQK